MTVSVFSIAYKLAAINGTTINGIALDDAQFDNPSFMMTACDNSIIRECAEYMRGLGFYGVDHDITEFDDCYRVWIAYDNDTMIDLRHYYNDIDGMMTMVHITIRGVEFQIDVDCDGWAYNSAECSSDPYDDNVLDPEIMAHHALTMYHIIDNYHNNIAIDTSFDIDFEFVEME